MGIKESIYALVDASTDIPVIFANENGPRPGMAYITLRIENASRLPMHRGPVDDDGQRDLSGHRDASVELQCFGDGSYDILDILTHRLASESMLAMADSLNLAVFDVGNLQDVPVLRNANSYEPRAILEISVRYTLTTDEDVGFIETVVGTEQTSGGATEIPERPFEATVVTP